MAPVTRRRGQSGSGVGAPKRVNRKQRAASREVSHDVSAKSWSNFEGEDDDDDDDDDGMNGYDSPDDAATAQPSIEGPYGVARALNPLSELAEKVGNEVESFAIALDEFVSGLQDREDAFDAAQELVAEFKAIAEKAVADLKKGHERERDLQLKNEWSQRAQLGSVAAPSNASKSLVFGKGGQSLFGRKAESVKALRQWEQEVDIWELFGLVLEIHYRPQDEVLREEREAALAALEPPHRYATENQIWERFVLEDDVAKERAMTKRWLEETADHQESNLSGIIEELEAKSGAGKGLWAKGWVNTREKIKSEKRLRTWPSASESIQPQIRRSDNNDLLVTTLDPDAASRQQRTLEKPDEYFERAFWIACWEMLRRGKPWHEVRQWCESHGQGWRAIIMGRAGEDQDVLSTAAWRKMCFVASQSACSNEYEAAVYGLLGGNLQAVQKITQTVDDNLYAHFSVQLIRQFNQYLQRNGLDKAAGGKLLDEDIEDPEAAQDSITKLVMELREGASTKFESIQPMKMIQSYLLANESESMINTIGYAISDEDVRRNKKEELVIVRMRDSVGKAMPETEVALDPHSLRIVTHMAIILALLRGNPLEDKNERDAEENVMVAYIQKLREAGKRDLTLLYASRLQRGRYIITLGRMLSDVTQAKEQEEMLKLMTNVYKMDTPNIISEHLDFLMETIKYTKPVKTPLTMLEKASEKVYPGQRVRFDFLPEEMTEDELSIVRSLQWFTLLEGQWEITFWALGTALRTCLAAGRVACALEIVRIYTYDDISKQKSYQINGRSINVMEDVISIHKDSEEYRQLEMMKRRSRTYYELEQLLQAIDAIAEWSAHETPYVMKNPKPSSVPQEIKKAKAGVDEAMLPILNGILQHSADAEEQNALDAIRLMYIPELIIAYNVVLYTGGSIYTRDCLLESMDLSVTLARDDNGLAATIARAGRMRELVTSFAYASKAILVLKAQNNKLWKPKKDREGKDPGIWEIGLQGMASGQALETS